MKARLAIFAVAIALAAISAGATQSTAQQQTGNTVPVTVEISSAPNPTYI